MKLIKRLTECATIGQADPILTRLGAGPAVRKLVETSIILANSPDKQQRNHAWSFMKEAVEDLQDSGAELKNHNLGQRTEGSGQSSDNEEPYPQVAKTTKNGEQPVEDMENTVNQWNEAGVQHPHQPQPNQGYTPGLDPGVAQELGGNKIPPMNASQVMRQIQYTVETMMGDFFQNKHNPLVREVVRLREVERQNNRRFTDLTNELKETKGSSGSMSLDLNRMRDSYKPNFKESSSNFSETTSDNDVLLQGAESNERHQLGTNRIITGDAKYDIIQMNKALDRAQAANHD